MIGGPSGCIRNGGNGPSRVSETPPRDEDPAKVTPIRPAVQKGPPKLFECKLCGKVFDAEDRNPACPECDSNDVEQVG